MRRMMTISIQLASTSSPSTTALNDVVVAVVVVVAVFVKNDLMVYKSWQNLENSGVTSVSSLCRKMVTLDVGLTFGTLNCGSSLLFSSSVKSSSLSVVVSTMFVDIKLL